MEAPTPPAARPGAEKAWAYRSAIATVVRPMRLLTRHDWQGIENLPPDGTGTIVCVNHISYVDPFATAQMLFDTGHPPFFLAKDALFNLRVLGPWLRASGQVPVYRGTGRAVDAFRDAVAAVNSGRTVAIMPESTLTKDPELWPMRAKTGAARVALETGRPVIPVAQWGAHELMPRGGRKLQPFPRKTMRMIVGPPVDLSDLLGRPVERDLLLEATTRIMDDITSGLEVLRGQSAPQDRFDPLVGRRMPRRHWRDEGGVA